MDELDVIRKRRLAALQQQQGRDVQRQSQEQQQLQQQIQQLESIVKKALTKDALVRYGSIKAAFPEKAVQVLVIIAQAIQSGQITTIDDQTLKQLLKKLEPEKKEFMMKRA